MQVTRNMQMFVLVTGCVIVFAICAFLQFSDRTGKTQPTASQRTNAADAPKLEFKTNAKQSKPLIRQEPAIQDTQESKLQKEAFAKLMAESLAPVAVLNPVEKQCPMYQEFRRLNFLHPALKKKLCVNADAYRLYPDGFPTCQLPNQFDEDMLNIVRQGSQIVGLLDLQNIRIPFFVYKTSDHISNTIRSSSAWEPEMVHWILRFALKLPQVTFLDMGSNIGVYSIQAAKLGLPVVSLDANIRNLLRMRLSLSASSLDAALVWNFIAPDQNLKYLSFFADCNVGGAGKDKRDLPDTVPVMPCKSERLCSFIKTKNVVMKMDIQGGETDFVLTSGCLFTDFNVAAVQMEWQQDMIHGNDSFVLTSFFTTRGYNVWRYPGFQALDLAKPNTWGVIDIIWIHRDFLKMM